MGSPIKNFKVDAAPKIATAIATAENDPTGNLGIRSLEPLDPPQVLMTSIMNNFNRWQGGKQPAPWIAERPKKFIDFMQRRWAPEGAENDPNGLNKNWAPNVRAILLKLLGPEKYKEWETLNIVQQQQGPTYG